MPCKESGTSVGKLSLQFVIRQLSTHANYFTLQCYKKAAARGQPFLMSNNFYKIASKKIRSIQLNDAA